MIKAIFKCIVAIAIVTLVVTIFPVAGTWMREFIVWLLSLGKWGVMSIFSIILIAIINFFE